MNNKTISKAVSLARRFIEMAEEYEAAKSKYESGGYTYTIISHKASGALRRSSMELTRALSEMRRPG